LGGDIPIIGVGGIRTPEDAYARILAGASLIQVYSGLIFEGPSMIGHLCAGISEQLKSDGFQRLADAVGTESGA